jgi:hypothetical protein
MSRLKAFTFSASPLPSFLNGTCTDSEYRRWLRRKAVALFRRDKMRKIPFALESSFAVYRQLIHRAVMESGLYDPYTGDQLRWDLIGDWDSKAAHEQGRAYIKEFALMPTIDHLNPGSETIEFEICSWQVNNSKGDFNPIEFINFCAKVVANNKFTDNKLPKNKVKAIKSKLAALPRVS